MRGNWWLACSNCFLGLRPPPCRRTFERTSTVETSFKVQHILWGGWQETKQATVRSSSAEVLLKALYFRKRFITRTPNPHQEVQHAGTEGEAYTEAMTAVVSDVYWNREFSLLHAQAVP